MSVITAPCGQYSNRTATAVVNSIQSHLIGFYVNSTTGGTIVFRDGGASGTVVSGTITPAIGYHAYPATFASGIHITIANTLDVTLFYAPA